MLKQQYTGGHVRHTGGKWRKPKTNKNKWGNKHDEKKTNIVCFEKKNIIMKTLYYEENKCLSCNTFGYYNGEIQCQNCYTNYIEFCHFCKTIDCYEQECGEYTCDVEMCKNHNCKVSIFCYKHKN
jgi:hypothetical protein